MREVIRYDVYGPDNLGISADGDLVRFEDYDALREQNRVLCEALAKVCLELECSKNPLLIQMAIWLRERQQSALTATSQEG